MEVGLHDLFQKVSLEVLGCQFSNSLARSCSYLMVQQSHPVSDLFKIWICPRSQLESLPHLSCSNLDICTIIGACVRLFLKICAHLHWPGLMLDHTRPVFFSRTDERSHFALSDGVSYSISQFCSCIWYSFKRISQDPQDFWKSMGSRFTCQTTSEWPSFALGIETGKWQ